MNSLRFFMTVTLKEQGDALQSKNASITLLLKDFPTIILAKRLS